LIGPKIADGRNQFLKGDLLLLQRCRRRENQEKISHLVPRIVNFVSETKQKYVHSMPEDLNLTINEYYLATGFFRG